MMKQRILEWINNLEGQSKKLKKKLQEPKQKKSSGEIFSSRRIAKIDDGILSATINTRSKDVVITIKGFASVTKAVDWATLQSILWRADLETRVQLQKDLTPNNTYH